MTTKADGPLSSGRPWLGLVHCPECQSDLRTKSAELICRRCKASYPLAQGRLILLRRANNLFAVGDYLSSPDPVQRSWARALVPSLDLNLSARRVLQRLREELDSRGPSTILVVGAGRQRPRLDPLIGGAGPHSAIYTDIDAGADMDVVCDAHDLPFVDGSFDAVVTTAVLEHVMYPERVAAEISRVVKVGGWLYSELPFMQQVHEGAYDFTRYTLSGHRRLFNSFHAVEAGMVAGPASALAWSIENFALAFVVGRRGRRVTAAMVRLGFFWLKYLDKLVQSRPAAMDGASCTFFFGTKVQQRITDRAIVNSYVGAKHLEHV